MDLSRRIAADTTAGLEALFAVDRDVARTMTAVADDPLRLAQLEMTGKAKFVKMNVDENPQVAGQFGIMSIPTLIVFKDGKPVNKLIGGQPKPQLKAFVEGAF